MTAQVREGALLLILVAGRRLRDPLLAMLVESGAHLINTSYGRGSVNASYLLSAFGLVAEKEKVVISCVLTKPRAEQVLQTLANRFRFTSANTGIAFTMPIECVSF